jgi:hypothetical protein
VFALFDLDGNQAENYDGINTLEDETQLRDSIRLPASIRARTEHMAPPLRRAVRLIPWNRGPCYGVASAARLERRSIHIWPAPTGQGSTLNDGNGFQLPAAANAISSPGLWTFFVSSVMRDFANEEGAKRRPIRSPRFSIFPPLRNPCAIAESFYTARNARGVEWQSRQCMRQRDLGGICLCFQEVGLLMPAPGRVDIKNSGARAKGTVADTLLISKSELFSAAMQVTDIDSRVAFGRYRRRVRLQP